MSGKKTNKPRKGGVSTKRPATQKVSAETPQQPRKTQREYQQAASAPATIDRNKIDPIIKVSFVVFLLASLVVLGATIYDKNFASAEPETVHYGDTLLVEYVGSLGTYYDKENAAIFDTNIKSVHDNTKYNKVAGFEKKTKFDTLEVEMTDSTGVIEPFRDALYGKRIGETVRFKVNADEGYPSTFGEHKTIPFKNNTMPKVIEGLDSAALKVHIKEGGFDGNGISVKTVYGWDAIVYKDADSRYSLVNMPSVKKYSYSDELDLNVTSVTGDTITFDYSLTEKGDKDVKENNVGMEILIDGKEFFVSGCDDTHMFYNDGANFDNDLYFVVKIIEKKD